MKVKSAIIDAYLGANVQKVIRGWHALKRMGGDRRVGFYYRADDPYSHLLAQQLPILVEEYLLELDVFLVPPSTTDFVPEPDMLRRFALADAKELARWLSIDFPEGAMSPADRPLDVAHRILALPRQGERWLEVALEVGRALWRNDERALEAAAKQHGAAKSDELQAILQRNAKRLTSRGHYQSATLEYEGEWYWGIDRLGHLDARLQHEGLHPTVPILPQRREGTAPVERLPETRDGKIVLELYFSFRSPFSYLALDRTLALAAKYPVDLRLKPVMPMVMRGIKLPAVKRLYLVRDAKREADRMGIPFGKIADPLGGGAERCLAIFRHAQTLGRAGSFSSAAMKAIWSEGIDVSTDEGMRMVIERSGLDFAAARAADSDQGWREMTAHHLEDLRDLGLWGVPSFRLANFVTWGQDRVWLLEEKLRRHFGR